MSRAQKYLLSIVADLLDHNPKLPTFEQINKEAFNKMKDL